MDEDEFFIGTRRDEEIPDAVKVMARGGDDNVSFAQVFGEVPEVIVFGQGGDDTISGQFGPEYEEGLFSGGAGNDDITAYGGVLRGQAGNDRLSTGRAEDLGFVATLRGGIGDDVLVARTGAGGVRNTDRLFGDAGDDIFAFNFARGTGRARATGGEGADTFGDFGVSGRLTITDFDFDAGDRIDIPQVEQEFEFDEPLTQTVGGTEEDPFLLVSYSGTNSSNGDRFFVTYKLLGLDAPLPDAAFI